MTTNKARNPYLRAILGVFVVALISAAVVFGIQRISRTPSTHSGDKPLVLATVPHIASWLSSIGGDDISVRTVVPQGLEVHDFSFSATSIGEMRDAALLVANGAGLETWLPALQEALPDLEIVDTSEGLSLTPGDPHTWLDPLLATQQIETISLALQRAVPAAAARIKIATTALTDQLVAFDHEVRSTLSSLPGRHFVAFHNAFGYFARRYGLEQVGKLVELPGDEPTFADVDELRAAVERFHLTTLFVEPGPVSDVAQNLADELSLELAILDPLESIESTPGAYLTGLQENLDVLAASLGNATN